jgi:hypothetical protein
LKEDSSEPNLETNQNNTNALDNQNANLLSDNLITVKIGEGEATLRRKDNQRGGPRVTRNITEIEVMAQIREICSIGHPKEKYSTDRELG